MKKVFVLVAVATLFAVSCKDDKKGEVLAPDQEKETLDETCTKAVEMVKVENWQATADIITQTSEAVQEIELSSDVYTWLANLSQSFVIEEGEVTVTTYDASKAKGAFTVVDNTLNVAESNDLTLAYTLADGTACDATVNVSANGTKVLVDTDYAYDEQGNQTETIDSKTYVIVPKSAEAKLNAAGKSAFGVKITTDLTLAGEVPQPSDKISATAEITAGDYTLAVTRALYSPTEVGVAASFKYGKTTVLAADFSAKGKLVIDEETQDPDLMKTSGKVNASIKLLDNVELKGDFDWDKVKAQVEKLHTAASEADAKAVATELEKVVNLTLYIQKTAQAKLGFEAYKPVESAEFVVWNVMPVIRFEDGSAYQLPEEFFSEDGFPKTIEAVSNLLAEIEATFSPTSESQPLE